MTGILLCFQLLLSPNCNAAFADFLMSQGDYYRAITEYKRVLYYCDNDSVRNTCLLKIAESYRKSQKFESSIQYSVNLVQGNKIPVDIRRKANLNLGLCYMETDMPNISIPYFRAALRDSCDVFPILCLGLAEIEMEHWDKANDILSASAKTCKDKKYFIDLTDKIEQFSKQSKKSPFLSTLFSIFLPGSGQVYSDHLYDGLQAFLFTTSFAFATYAVYQYEKSEKNSYALTYVGISLTALFHSANIIGANQTARYRNRKLHYDFVKSIRKDIMDFE